MPRWTLRFASCIDRLDPKAPPDGRAVETVATMTCALNGAKIRARDLTKDPTSPTGYYWLQDKHGVPWYGVRAWDEEATERVPIPAREEGGRAGFTTRRLPGQYTRKIKAGNLWRA